MSDERATGRSVVQPLEQRVGDVLWGPWVARPSRGGEHLHVWRAKAEKIPSPDLRAQALMSLQTKAFHSAGGGSTASWRVSAGGGHPLHRRLPDYQRLPRQPM